MAHLDDRQAAERALALALAADALFLGGMALAWSREFVVAIPRRLPDVLIVLGLGLAVAVGVRLLRITHGAAGWWRRTGPAFGLALALSGLPAAVLLAWAVYQRAV